jgi:putative chitinase
MNITLAQLTAICQQQSALKLEAFVGSLNAVLPNYGINTILRIQHFLAQAAHETGQFQFLTELASGSAYEGRKDLGNVNPGDGMKFKGRGIFQTTGRANYKAVSIHLFNDERLLTDPSVLVIPEYAVKSAAFYWQSRNINQFADADDVLGVTKRINGGTNGLQDRMKYLTLAKQEIK